jgi:hypothetical protein
MTEAYPQHVIFLGKRQWKSENFFDTTIEYFTTEYFKVYQHIINFGVRTNEMI